MIIKEILGGGLTTPMLEWLQVEHVDCDHYCNTLYLGGGGSSHNTSAGMVTNLVMKI